MPYLRLQSPYLPIERKRAVTQKLIEITLRAFHLRPEERHSITVQFISPPEASDIDGHRPLFPRATDFVLEVIAHHLTDAKKRAFREEVINTLPPLLQTKAARFASLLRMRLDPRRLVTLQFAELSPDIGDPFTEEIERRAA